MASLAFLYFVFLFATSFPLFINAGSDCNGTCATLDDCNGQLICINAKCNDDPEVGTSICKAGGSAAPGPQPVGPISSCNRTCTTLDDCSGELICINKKCNDDPDVGTHICKAGGSASPPSPSQGASPPSPSQGYRKKSSTVQVALFVTIPLLICILVTSVDL